MSDTIRCPFCGELAARSTETFTFRCGTRGPDEHGEYSTGHTCDITTFTREIERHKECARDLERQRDDLQAEVDTLTQQIRSERRVRNKAESIETKRLHRQLRGTELLDKESLIQQVTELTDEVEKLTAENQRLLDAIYERGETPQNQRRQIDPVNYLRTRYVTVGENNERNS